MEKVWIYQADRKMSDEEVAFCKQQLSSFIENWSSHGSILRAGFKVMHNLFVIVCVKETEEAQASGCAIDGSVKLIKKMEQSLGLSFFDRTKIAYYENGSVKLASMDEFAELLKNGRVHENTYVFNNLITLKQDMEEKWMVPLKNSWHMKLLPVS